jgi:hypothetical protein
MHIPADLDAPLTLGSACRYRTLAIDRPLMFAFWQRLLSSGMRTVDAEEVSRHGQLGAKPL